jgi:polygalacturonase
MAAKAQSGETAPAKAVPRQQAATDLRTFNGVVLHPAPTGIASSPDYSVTVNGQQAFVYNPKVKTGRDHPQANMGMCYFDCTDSATVTVHANVSMSNVVIRPKSYGIKPAINGQDITFTIRKTQKATIEPNGYAYNALVIFANALETNPPQQSDPNVIYYGPGLHTPGQINLLDNQTLYLAGGAVVRGHVYARGATNVKIMGHGIIDQSLETRQYRFINLVNCSNVTINGLILLDNSGWCVTPQYCTNVSISDMKLICWRSNTDGIDVVGCNGCTIDNCYIRNWDDGVVLKSFNGTDVHDVTVQNCIFWSDLAEALEIGYELEAGRVDSVRFTNIDIIHAFHNNALSIHNSAQAVVSDIRYEDIRIEDLDPLYCSSDEWPNNGLTPGTHVVDLWIGKSRWTTTGGQGIVRNIYFKNVSATLKPGAPFPLSRIVGFDASHTIDTVTFENFTVDGKVVISTADAHITTNSANYFTNVTFRAPGP